MLLGDITLANFTYRIPVYVYVQDTNIMNILL